MGKQAGIDDSGDPLWASLIQNRVRDNTRCADERRWPVASRGQVSRQGGGRSPSIKYFIITVPNHTDV